MGGTAVLENFVPEFDSTVVKKFKEANSFIGEAEFNRGCNGRI